MLSLGNQFQDTKLETKIGEENPAIRYPMVGDSVCNAIADFAFNQKKRDTFIWGTEDGSTDVMLDKKIAGKPASANNTGRK